MGRRSHSISMPIILGAVTVALSIAMLVGWIVVILQNSALTRQVTQNTWLLVAGIVSLGVIISVLTLFSVFLVHETLELRRQDSFIDSVTHELKSPLASLKLCLETLARSEVRPVQREELRHMMLADVERLSIFIDGILEASALVHGHAPHTLGEVHLTALVDRCADSVCKRYLVPFSTIERQVDPSLYLLTDGTGLEIILKNLLDNAVKYSNPPMQVTISADWTPREGLGLHVQDAGIGISPAHLRRIFGRFYRVPDEAVRTRRGTGLGLFVVSAIVRTLKGRLQVESGGPGCGALFRVVLPTCRKAERR